MIKAISAVLQIIAMSYFLYSPSHAKDGVVDLESFAKQARKDIKYIRNSWIPHLSSLEKRVETETDYFVPITWNSNGMAYRNCQSNEDRKIIITAGQVVVLSMISAAINHLEDGHMNKQCFQGYLDHLSKGLRANNESARTSGLLSITPVYFPEGFAFRNPAICSAIRNPSTEGWYVKHGVRMISSMKMLLGHELGHQVYNDGCNHVSPRESRENEAKADNFAIELMIKDDPSSLLTALPLFIYWSIESPMKSIDELGNSHPAGLRRLRNALDIYEAHAITNKNSAIYKWLAQNDKLERIKVMISAFRKQTKGLD